MTRGHVWLVLYPFRRAALAAGRADGRFSYNIVLGERGSFTRYLSTEYSTISGWDPDSCGTARFWILVGPFVFVSSPPQSCLSRHFFARRGTMYSVGAQTY